MDLAGSTVGRHDFGGRFMRCDRRLEERSGVLPEADRGAGRGFNRCLFAAFGVGDPVRRCELGYFGVD